MHLKTILSVSSILKVLAPPAKKSFDEKSKQTKSISENPSFQREKWHVQRFNFSLLQTYHSRKCANIFATLVIEIGVRLQNFKVCFSFLCR